MIYSNGVRSIVLQDVGNALSIRLLDIIKLMIKEMNSDSYKVGAL